MPALNRRHFLAASGATALQPLESRKKPMTGIQVGAVSFVDEGVEPVLDTFQERAAVNTLFIATFTYGRGIAGRQVAGQPLPDHGKQEYDTGFRGGAFHNVNLAYYKDTILKDVRSRDYGNFDVLQSVIPQARKRGMAVICWFEDVWRNDVPHIDRLQEKDLYGRNAGTLCFNNPDHRAWLLGMTENLVRDYDVD
ncbi:MAG: hypothetical protein HZB13_16695, partial [Acidobacteria bacterium]|nr:hypothetical protein [Acidobacteriota bacterium]